MTSDWLAGQGITPQVLWGYKNSGWLVPLGRGAWIRAGQSVEWTAAVFALQRQSRNSVWPAGRTALTLLGQAHYIPQGSNPALQLAVIRGYRLPAWFQRLPFGRNLVKFSATSLFEPIDIDTGLTSWNGSAFALDISSPERAAVGLCAMTSADAEPEEVKALVQGLPALRPALLQKYLSLAARSRPSACCLSWQNVWNTAGWINWIPARSTSAAASKASRRGAVFIGTIRSLCPLAGKCARVMPDFSERYIGQTRLLLTVLPYVGRQTDFALKGGTERYSCQRYSCLTPLNYFQLLSFNDYKFRRRDKYTVPRTPNS